MAKTAPLTDSEIQGLRFIGARYVSGDILHKEWDEETGEIDDEHVIAAFIATGGDGGDPGTVPLAGGTLEEKINDLFDQADAWSYVDAAEEYGAEEGSADPYDFVD